MWRVNKHPPWPSDYYISPVAPLFLGESFSPLAAMHAAIMVKNTRHVMGERIWLYSRCLCRVGGGEGKGLHAAVLRQIDDMW